MLPGWRVDGLALPQVGEVELILNCYALQFLVIWNYLTSSASICISHEQSVAEAREGLNHILADTSAAISWFRGFFFQSQERYKLSIAQCPVPTRFCGWRWAEIMHDALSSLDDRLDHIRRFNSGRPSTLL
jgi:hypothetical protein